MMQHAETKIAGEKPRPARPAMSRSALIAVGLMLCAGYALASGPRWVTGPPYFTGPSGNPVVWYTWQPLYFTDRGDLSASVNHAAADAMVSAAAGVWNVPTAGLTVAYGGPLNQHVSAANAYLGNNGPVFPADVQSSNYAAKQIAVIYDSDGSVTDMLLGSGASNPSGCRQNAVTESVDLIAPSGSIQHAILVLNGRCTGPAPEQQLQMQYQLERAFGRVLGIGWSQTNDNVFTRTPQPTYNQALHWPIMHPIDILCGPYTYQCMPKPFTLRDDDVSAITSLYPLMVWDRIPSAPPAPGKVWSYQQASQGNGTVSFPTGQGMQGVNVVIQRQQGGVATPESFYDVSSVSGYLFQQNAGNPVTGPASGISASMGSTDSLREGMYKFGWIPNMDPANSFNGPMLAVVSTEPINPLYSGQYSVGPYVAQSIAPSGASTSRLTDDPFQIYLYGWSSVLTNLAPWGAAGNCDGDDGVESAPRPVASSGWWTAVLSLHNQAAWSSYAPKGGRTATLEVTALDESGLATIAKAMPLIGVWAASDNLGTLPTVAATPSAFNTVSLGMTAAGISTALPQTLRFAVADARGDGRPDFAYQARMLYADTIQPAITSASGGLITITGMGFRAGNQVLVNGVAAVVSSLTATSIVAVAPLASAFRASPVAPVDIAVVDLSTHGTTVMSSALAYTNIAPDTMTLVSAPSGNVAMGEPAAVPLAVRVLLGDGATPVVGMPVTFAIVSGSAKFAACATTPCVVQTDANGLASTSVTPSAFGMATVQASAVGVIRAATFNAIARNMTPVRPVEYLAPGATVVWTPQMTATESGVPAAGVSVNWTASGAMLESIALSITDTLGVAQTQAVSGPLKAGEQATGQACAWTTTCASFSVMGLDPSAWRIVVVSGAGQIVPLSGSFAPIVLRVTDQDGHPVAGASVAVHQTVDAAEMPCPVHDRCPVPPVLGASTRAATSDADGLLSVIPLQIPGVAEVTNVAVATGTQGFVSLSLEQAS